MFQGVATHAKHLFLFVGLHPERPDGLQCTLLDATHVHYIIVIVLACSYAGLKQLPPGFVDLVKKYNPHITELELSR